MTVELEEFTQWRHSVEARLGSLELMGDEQADMLQALHLTQNEHTTALRKLQTGQEELRLGQAQVLAGVQTIVDLLKPADGTEGAS